MKVCVSKDSIVAYRFGRKRFDATLDEITDVALLLASDYIPPLLLAKLIRPKLKLSSLFLWSENQSVALISRDRGFDEAVTWLKQNNWDIDAAIERAKATPYIKVVVGKAPTY
jgi:hypothetical protein